MKYKIILFLVISALSLVGCQSAQSQKAISQKVAPQKAEWQAASIQNIQVGKTKIKDAENVFGEKLHQTTLKDGNETEIWHEYKVKLFDKWDGKLTLIEKEEIVTSILFEPVNLSKSEAINFFGSDFLISHYRADESVSDESVPLIEDEKGDTEAIEYRNKGIAIFPDEKNMVRDIEFVSQPIGKQSTKNKESPKEK